MSETSSDSSDEVGYKIIGKVYPIHYNHNTIEGAKPNNLKYRTLKSRLESFINWPKADVDINKLAEAGFFYLGRGDQTKCFQCDLTLVNWQPQDDPLVEHGKQWHNCHYLYVRCGIEFITSCYFTDEPVCISTPQLAKSEDKRYICRICEKNEVGCILHPCEHAVACSDCAVYLEECPVCESIIRKVLRMSFID